MTQEIIDKLLDPIQTARGLLFSGANQDPQGDVEKHSIFIPVSQAEKVRETVRSAFTKHHKSIVESSKTIAKTWFSDTRQRIEIVLKITETCFNLG